ncbi:MAG: hypothetical protein AAGL23_07070 [Pseudomonadota bacterium]
MDQDTDRGMIAALATLIILQAVMLLALFAGIRPHPPEVTPLFGIAPLIGASIAAAMAAIILRPSTRIGLVFALVAAVFAAVSFGPQKYFDAQFALIWPAVVAGQIAILSVVISTVRTGRRTA